MRHAPKAHRATCLLGSLALAAGALLLGAGGGVASASKPPPSSNYDGAGWNHRAGGNGTGGGGDTAHHHAGTTTTTSSSGTKTPAHPGTTTVSEHSTTTTVPRGPSSTGDSPGTHGSTPGSGPSGGGSGTPGQGGGAGNSTTVTTPGSSTPGTTKTGTSTTTRKKSGSHTRGSSTPKTPGSTTPGSNTPPTKTPPTPPTKTPPVTGTTTPPSPGKHTSGTGTGGSGSPKTGSPGKHTSGHPGSTIPGHPGSTIPGSPGSTIPGTHTPGSSTPGTHGTKTPGTYTPGSSTTTTHTHKHSTPGSSVPPAGNGSGVSTKGSVPGQTTSSTTPAKSGSTTTTPPAYTTSNTFCPSGSSEARAGDTCYVVQQNGTTSTSPPLPAGCAWFSGSVELVVYGTDMAYYCSASSTTTQTASVGIPVAEWGGQNPGQVCVAHWELIYGGKSYTYAPAGGVCDGGLNTSYSGFEAVCDNAPTYATVEYWISLASENWPYPNLNGPPPSVDLGPFSAQVEAPACAPDAQLDPTGVSWSLAYGASTLRGEEIVADGAEHPFVLEPHITNGVDPMLRWDGFSATPSILNYSADQIGIPGNNTAWDAGIDPSSPTGGGMYPASDVESPTYANGALRNYTGLEPIVDVALHEASTAGDPFELEVRGSYSAAWAHWFTGFAANPSCSEATRTGVIYAVIPGHSAEHVGGTWIPGKYTKKGVYVPGHWDGGYEVPSVPTQYEREDWSYPTNCTVTQAVNFGLEAKGGHQATFPVSLTIPIVGVKPYIVNG